MDEAKRTSVPAKKGLAYPSLEVKCPTTGLTRSCVRALEANSAPTTPFSCRSLGDDSFGPDTDLSKMLLMTSPDTRTTCPTFPGCGFALGRAFDISHCSKSGLKTTSVWLLASRAEGCPGDNPTDTSDSHSRWPFLSPSRVNPQLSNHA